MKVNYSRPNAKPYYRKSTQETPKKKRSSLFYWRIIICGGIFAIGIALKLLLPSHLEKTRKTIGEYMVREADFVGAFTSIGHAVSGEQSVSQSVKDACVAVFGGNQNTVEVFAPQSENVQKLRELPQYASSQEQVLNFSFQSPIIYTDVTSPFAWRSDPNGGEDEFHYGIDLAAEEGTNIVAFADGTVGVVGESKELGKYLTLQHANGITTLYGHCKSILVCPDDSVQMGQVIATVGQSGNATGSHLHFAVQEGEVYLNPQYYLSSQTD